MIYRTKFTAFFLFFLSIHLTIAQDIISKDGHNMGPRKYFLDACAMDENGNVRIDYQLGYSSLDFCNCLAEEMIPKMTKKEINYYFGENRHVELYKDTLLSNKARQCMKDAQNQWKSITPPPQEEITIRVHPTQSLVDSIIDLVDYEQKFYQILEKTLEGNGKLSIAQKEKLLNKIKYDSINPEVIRNAYMDYSKEDVELIIDYLTSLSTEEFRSSESKYERDMISFFTKHIELRIEEFLDSE